MSFWFSPQPIFPISVNGTLIHWAAQREIIWPTKKKKKKKSRKDLSVPQLPFLIKLRRHHLPNSSCVVPLLQRPGLSIQATLNIFSHWPRVHRWRWHSHQATRLLCSDSPIPAQLTQHKQRACKADVMCLPTTFIVLASAVPCLAHAALGHSPSCRERQSPFLPPALWNLHPSGWNRFFLIRQSIFSHSDFFSQLTSLVQNFLS